MRYGDCRWVDIDAMDKDGVVVVCPIAALEQHGHHLPLLTDTYLATEVAERVEQAVPDKVLLTPTLWVGASDHHLDFPGTVSLPNTLYVEVIKNVVRCFVRAGFRRILLLNGHGGNIAPGTVAITELANECDDGGRVVAGVVELLGTGRIQFRVDLAGNADGFARLRIRDVDDAGGQRRDGACRRGDGRGCRSSTRRSTIRNLAVA